VRVELEWMKKETSPKYPNEKRQRNKGQLRGGEIKKISRNVRGGVRGMRGTSPSSTYCFVYLRQSSQPRECGVGKVKAGPISRDRDVQRSLFP